MSDVVEIRASEYLVKYEQDFCKFCTSRPAYHARYKAIKELVKKEIDKVSIFLGSPQDCSKEDAEKITELLHMGGDSIIKNYIILFTESMRKDRGIKIRFSDQDILFLTVKIFYSIFITANRELLDEEARYIKLGK
jgi:hypothetical protein